MIKFYLICLSIGKRETKRKEKKISTSLILLFIN